MITAIRELRRAMGLTLAEVAARCDPPTTAQSIGRLETGTRTVSVAWLNRIAAALGVTAADLVTLPERADLPIAAMLDASGAHPLRSPATAALPSPSAGMVAVRVGTGVGDYRSGDVVWCEPLNPDGFAAALNRDVLVPRPVGRYAFGRLVDRAGGRLHILPPSPGVRQQVVSDPPWLAVARTLVRTL